MLRAHFGGYFLGQVATFAYLIHTMSRGNQFDVADWPQFSIYNLVVANFWPFYWIGYFFDAAKLETVYWHVYAVAQARASDMMQVYELFSA